MKDYTKFIFTLVMLITICEGRGGNKGYPRNKGARSFKFQDFILSLNSPVKTSYKTAENDDVQICSPKQDCSVMPYLARSPDLATFLLEDENGDWASGFIDYRWYSDGFSWNRYEFHKRYMYWNHVSTGIHPYTSCQVLEVQLYAVGSEHFGLLTVRNNLLLVQENHYYELLNDFPTFIPPDGENTVWLHMVKYYEGNDNVRGLGVYTICESSSCDYRVASIATINQVKINSVHLSMNILPH